MKMQWYNASVVFTLQNSLTKLGKECYRILLFCVVSRELLRLTQMCFSETYSETCKGKYFSDAFPVNSSLKYRNRYFIMRRS